MLIGDIISALCSFFYLIAPSLYPTEAAPSRKSRWDRSSRDESRWDRKAGGDRSQKTDSSKDRHANSSTESGHREYNDGDSSRGRYRERSPLGDRDRDHPRVSETSYYPIDREESSSRSQSYRYEHSAASRPEPENHDQDSSDNLDSLRDEALEEQFRKYERECQAQSGYESQPRDYKTAFSGGFDSDSVPSEVSDEPLVKKSGFSMTMNRSQASSSPIASGFSMSLSKPVTMTTSSLPKKPVAPIKMSLGVQVSVMNILFRFGNREYCRSEPIFSCICFISFTVKTYYNL